MPESSKSEYLLDGSSGQAFLIRGEARRALKNFDEAIEDYHRTLNLQEFRSGTLRTAAFWIVGTGMRKHRSGTQILYPPPVFLILLLGRGPGHRVTGRQRDFLPQKFAGPNSEVSASVRKQGPVP
jgi:hypothetical protein